MHFFQPAIIDAQVEANLSQTSLRIQKNKKNNKKNKNKNNKQNISIFQYFNINI